MRRSPATSAFVLCLLLVSVPALSVASAGLESTLPPPPRGGVEKTMEGRVSGFVPSVRITLQRANGTAVTLPLDEPGVETTVAPEVAVGAWVRVVESRLVDGKRSISVTVVPAPAGRA